MSLDFWTMLWEAVLLGSVGLFAVLVVVVAIGGAVDVARLLRSLREEHARSAAGNAEGTGEDDVPGSERSF